MSEASIQWFERKIRKLKRVGAHPSTIRIYQDELKRLKNRRNLAIYEGVP